MPTIEGEEHELMWFLAHGGDDAIHIFGLVIPEFALVGLPGLIGGLVALLTLRTFDN